LKRKLNFPLKSVYKHWNARPIETAHSTAANRGNFRLGAKRQNASLDNAIKWFITVNTFYDRRDIQQILVSFLMLSVMANSTVPLPTSRNVRLQREMEKNGLEYWKNLDNNYLSLGGGIKTIPTSELVFFGVA